jgi:hypothetical protein
MPSKATRARILAEVRQRIDEHGWSVQAVGADCSVPGCCSARRRGKSDSVDFGYTAGLIRYRGHPELIVTGVPQRETIYPLNLLGSRVRDGERFADGDIVEGVLRDGLVALQAVDARKSETRLVVANDLYRKAGGPPVDALQVVWPDVRGLYPWDSGYALPAAVQPLLGPVSKWWPSDD